MCRIKAEGRVTDSDRMEEVSRRHSSRWKRALKKTGRSHPGEGRNGARIE